MNDNIQLASKANDFDHWVQACLFLPEHKTGTDVLERAVDLHLISLYRDLELHTLLQQHPCPQSLATALGYSDDAWIALNALLKRLSDRHDFINCLPALPDQPAECHRFEPVRLPTRCEDELTELKQTMQSLGQEYVAPLEFLEFGRTHFERTLRDDHEFMDRVLTGQEKDYNETWDRATNTDPLQDIHGIMGAKALEMLFAGGSILEIGGGTGNGMRNNLDTLLDAKRESTVDRYVFTDVSMPFILNTKRSLQSRFQTISCEWRLLNINKDWAAQRIEANSMALIYGVNAAHIAMHTVDFLHECKRALNPGGLVVFSERLRRYEGDMAPRELVLNLSSYHRTAAIRHPEYRPAHAYLTAANWSRAFELAGYSEFCVWPDPDSSKHYFPEQYAAVIVGRV